MHAYASSSGTELNAAASISAFLAFFLQVPIYVLSSSKEPRGRQLKIDVLEGNLYDLSLAVVSRSTTADKCWLRWADDEARGGGRVDPQTNKY